MIYLSVNRNVPSLLKVSKEREAAKNLILEMFRILVRIYAMYVQQRTTRILLFLGESSLAKDYVGVCRLMGSKSKVHAAHVCRVRECGGQVQHGIEYATRNTSNGYVLLEKRKRREGRM